MRDKRLSGQQEQGMTSLAGDNKYRRLIEQMLNAYALHEIICDDQGHPIDYRFLEVNPAFEQMTGFRAESLVGRTVLEVMPQTEPSWIERYGQVALTGEPIHFEDFSRQPNRYFEVMAFCPAPNQFACTFADISERKQTENALRESQEHFAAFFRQAPLGYQSLDTDGRFIEVNEAWLATLGYSQDEVIGKWFGDFLAPEYADAFRQRFPVFKAEGKIQTEFEMLHKNGERRFIGFEGRIRHNSGGEFERTHCILQDITESRRADLALVAAKEQIEKSEKYLENIINNIGDPVFVKDDQSRLLLANDAFCTIFDLERDQIIGKTLAEDVPPDEMERFLRVDRQVIADGKENIVEEKLTVRGGETRTIHTRKSRFIDSSGNRFLIGIIRDISDRKQAELALATEKERLAVTLRSIGDGVITTDVNGDIILLNKVAEAMTGWQAEEAAGRPLLEVFNIINERTREKCQNPVEQVLATGHVVELANHTSLIAKDGREIIIADSGAPIYDNESQIIGVVLVFRDMTEKQRLEDFIQKSQKLESLGVLAGGIAHDFNNLLGAIFGFTERAMAKTTNEEVTIYLAKSVNTIDRARALTQQLLTFAKGGAPIRKVENLFPFAQETAQFALSGSAVSSNFKIQEELWPCDFDKNQIGQVIDNLTINAQQAMPTGGVIEISAQNVTLSEEEYVSLTAGDYVKLSIKDQGIGIPKKFLPRIFDPYYTTKTKGHGLGLATCYSIITRHDGWIDVESEPGKGSTFHVYLPASVESSLISQGKPAEEHTGSGTFLVMDDEPVIREVMKDVLESFGYTVVLTSRGEEAIEFCVTETKANREIVGMIFDLTIPGGMGGKEAIREIRRICPDTPAFVASGYSVDPIMANPEAFGFTASLPKPFTIDELSDMLEKHLTKAA